MSTSKIGRGIKTRDVVTPGFTGRKNNTSNESIKKKMEEVLIAFDDLQAICEHQVEQISELKISIAVILEENKQSNIKIKSLQSQLDKKTNIINSISNSFSKIENKVNKLESSLDTLKSKLNEKKNQKWSIF